MIQSIKEHNVGDQQLTFRMAANAIWNKLNFGLSPLDNPKHTEQLREIMIEARALADSIVNDNESDNKERKQ